jgi:murein DD-endopeptidase MepM/ murein hydrolase activator NlpD
VYIAFDYISLRSQLAGMEELQELKTQQEKKIGEFDEQYQDLQLHFNHLTELNDKLKAMVITTIDSERKSKTRLKDAEQLKAKLEIAKKTSVLDTIATDSSELDSDLRYERDARFTNLISFFKTQKNPFVKIPSGMPVKGYLVDEFGMHTDPYTGQVRPQNGIDIASRLDYPITAPADGIILELKQDEDLGNVLVVDHGNGFITKYGHLNRFDLDVGDIVKKGNVIAQVGNSGHTTGPRLYYEVLFNEVPQNPIKYMNN